MPADHSSISARKTVLDSTTSVFELACIQGYGYSWLLSWHHNIFVSMVPKTRADHENSCILQRHICFWSSRRPYGIPNGKTFYCTRKRHFLQAYASTRMSGVFGLESWRWLFLLPGLMVTPLGIITYCALGHLPETVQC